MHVLEPEKNFVYCSISHKQYLQSSIEKVLHDVGDLSVSYSGFSAAADMVGFVFYANKISHWFGVSTSFLTLDLWVSHYRILGKLLVIRKNHVGRCAKAK